MSIEVRVAGSQDLEEWDAVVDSSEMGTVFHRLNFLKLISRHTKSDLWLLMGFKGREIVGLFPVFHKRWPFVSALLSAPPQVAVPYLGMVMVFGSSKQDKRERDLNDFLEGCLSLLDEGLNVNYINFSSPPGFHDIRNFLWKGYSAEPSFDYVIDTTDIDAVWAGFSKGLRKNIRRGASSGLVFSKSEPEARSLYYLLMQRYEAQGIRFTLKQAYLEDLVETLADQIEYFMVQVGPTVMSELLCLRDRNALLLWLGGYSSQVEGSGDRTIYPNEYLHWKVIEYAGEENIESVQIIGANTPQLCTFKSKFGPRLLLSFRVKKVGILASAAERLYSLWKFRTLGT